MGASSSVEQKVPSETKVVEDRAASMGSLSMLRDAFSIHADPLTNLIQVKSLERCLGLKYKKLVFECDDPEDDLSLSLLLNFVGPSIVEVFFVPDNEGVDWIQFVKGYLRCCQKMATSVTLNGLFRVFAMAARKAGISLNIDVAFDTDGENHPDEHNDGCKLGGALERNDVLMFLMLCWSLDSSFMNSSFIEAKERLFLPDFSHLVASAMVSCAENADDENSLILSDYKVSNLSVKISLGKFYVWILATLPCLGECFTNFVNARLRPGSAIQSATPNSSQRKIDFMNYPYLLSLGRAWGISLTLQDAIKSEVMNIFTAMDDKEVEHHLLYRSSNHGRGLNRLWSNIEGYHGSLLVLISASHESDNENESHYQRWIFGVRTEKGLENKDVFYGNSGTLYAIYPIFRVFSPTGREKNFIYSHLHASKRAYEPHPKPVGIAFGGSLGKERIFIDEDFARVTLRHHAVDKTYQPGYLIPSQGYLPVEGVISDVEVWGLGGARSKNEQMSYKKREELFIEQRRKVDLKNFGSWEDAPEKIMMDMMSDPNKVSREDR